MLETEEIKHNFPSGANWYIASISQNLAMVLLISRKYVSIKGLISGQTNQLTYTYYKTIYIDKIDDIQVWG